MELRKHIKGIDLFLDRGDRVEIISSEDSSEDSKRRSYELKINGVNVLYDIYTDRKNSPSAKLVYEIWRRPNLARFVPFISVKYNMGSEEIYVLSKKISYRSQKPYGLDCSSLQDICRSLKEFLSGIHSLGFTHGDFTDSNILWEGKRPYVIDFERSVDQIDFVDDFSYYKMIDYADLVISLGKINSECYVKALKFANIIKRFEDLLLQGKLSSSHRVILDDLNKNMMESF
jgi:thiamine kinase-like enzyme